MSVPVYTIGYGNRSLDEFASLLEKYGIRYLIDVRSHPFSGYKKEFDRDALARFLTQKGIIYAWWGNSLGGKPSSPTVKNEELADVHRRIAAQPTFQRALDRIETALAKKHMICLMCSELLPQMCHRSILIGSELDKRGVNVKHIDENGNELEQREIRIPTSKLQMGLGL